MKKLNIAAAIIQHNDKYLCVQRGQHKLPYIANKWEFPSGKIEIDETPQQAIVREINEELKLDITPIKTTVIFSDLLILMMRPNNL